MRIADRVRSRLPHGDFGRGVVTLVAGTGLAQIIVIASSPIFTRLYSPADYGAYAVALSILSILISVTCLRYEFAIPLPEDDVVAAHVLALSLLIAAGMSLASGIVLWLVGPWLFAMVGATVLSPYALLLSLGQFGGGVVSAFTNWAIRTKTFSQIAATRLTQSGTLVSVQIALGIAGFGAIGLLIGDVAGRISGSSRLARAAWRSNASSFRQVSRMGVLAAAQRYRRFPIFSSGSALLANVGVQMPVLFMVAFYGTTVGGQFALAQRVGAIPITLVAAAVGQVFIADAARLAHDEPKAVRTLFGRTTRNLARLAIGPAGLVAILAPILAGPVLGANWAETGVFVAILVPSFYLEFVMAATGDLLYVLERQDLHLAREILRFCLIGGAVPLAATVGLPPTGAVMVVSAAGCLTYGLYGLISWRAIVRHRGRTPTVADEGHSLA